MGNKKVLHVEDRAQWQKAVKLVLRDEGFEVISFTHLPDAQAAVESAEFDYFICDRNIAGKDGDEWAAELHAQGKKVIILASGHSDNDSIPFLSKGDLDRLPELLQTL